MRSQISETGESSSLQRELEIAYQEIEHLQGVNMGDVWAQKIELVEKEKKLLADELQKIARGFQQRESQLTKDLKLC